METFQEFTDPRLVALYDAMDQFRTDIAFYIELAIGMPSASVLDVGCGTGLLACELAQRGHRVTGVDPSSVMLDVARRRPGGELVCWIEGDLARLDEADFDLAIMSGHVPQIIVDDKEWYATPGAIHRALRPEGTLAFESRNPLARAWTAWIPQESRRYIDHAEQGRVEMWQDLLEVQDDCVLYEIHYRFLDTGIELVSTDELRFRSQAELAQALTVSGFTLERIYGDWDGRAVQPDSDELIFIAKKAVN